MMQQIRKFPVGISILTVIVILGFIPMIIRYIYGLGGRDTNEKQILSIYEDLTKILETNKIKNKINYVGLRE